MAGSHYGTFYPYTIVRDEYRERMVARYKDDSRERFPCICDLDAEEYAENKWEK